MNRLHHVFWVLATASLIARAAAAEDGAKVYEAGLRSTAWIAVKLANGTATGTGTLVDADKRLVMTNYHVVGNSKTAVVMFPLYTADGRPIAERTAYKEAIRTKGIRANVVRVDRQHDLALIQLEKIPSTVKAMPLASKGVSPGQSIHSIGNPGGSGALWVYTPGKVRQVYHHRWQAKLHNGVATFDAQVIETDSATNSGDSGGPLMNDNAELVGVTHGGATNQRLLSTFIDLSEVKKFLGGSGATAATKREKAIAVSDNAKFFSEDAVSEANKVVGRLLSKHGFDVLFETHSEPPEDKRDEVKKMDKKDRDKYVADWLNRRKQKERIDGAVVLICKSPAVIRASYGEAWKSRVGADFAKKQADALVDAFRAKEFDRGLREWLDELEKRLDETGK